MRLQSNGNIGIGTSNPGVIPGWSLFPDFKVLEITGSATSSKYSDGLLLLSNNRPTATFDDQAGAIAFSHRNNNGNHCGAIETLLTGSGGANGFGGQMRFSTKGDNSLGHTPRVVITDNGNVGIGIISPTNLLHTLGTDQVIQKLESNNNAGCFLSFKATGSGGNEWWTGSTAPGNSGGSGNFLIWNATNSTYPFVITPSGNTGIGTAFPSQKLHVSGGAIEVVTGNRSGNLWAGTSTIDGVEIAQNAFIGIQRGNATNLALTKPSFYSDGTYQLFAVAGSFIGSINTLDGFTTNYNTTSDKRLKENIVATTYGLTTINKLKLYDYNYIADASKTLHTGFIAQELYEVFPQSVTKGGDNPKEKPWMVDYSKLVPMLVKGMQEQQAQIELLKQQIEKLSKK